MQCRITAIAQHLHLCALQAIWELFDLVVVLSEGFCLYAGPVSEVQHPLKTVRKTAVHWTRLICKIVCIIELTLRSIKNSMSTPLEPINSTVRIVNAAAGYLKNRACLARQGIDSSVS